jgi:hypothetical protein
MRAGRLAQVRVLRAYQAAARAAFPDRVRVSTGSLWAFPQPPFKLPAPAWPIVSGPQLATQAAVSPQKGVQQAAAA